jgi:hypothetical protein
VPEIATSPQARVQAIDIDRRRPRRGRGYEEWVGAQVLFVLAGMLAALLALAVAPRASTMALRAINTEPARCLALGTAGAIGLTLLNGVNSALFATIIWIPAGLLVALATALVFLYGGLLGIAYVGSLVGRWVGVPPRGFFAAATCGLVFLGLLNCIPVVNAVSLLIETGAFVMGLGALIVTGMGSDPDWLTGRLAEAARAFRSEE